MTVGTLDAITRGSPYEKASSLAIPQGSTSRMYILVYSFGFRPMVGKGINPLDIGKVCVTHMGFVLRASIGMKPLLAPVGHWGKYPSNPQFPDQCRILV